MMERTAAASGPLGGTLRRAIGGVLLSVAGFLLIQTMLLPLATSSWPAAGPVPDLDDALSGLFAWAALAITAWVTLGTALGGLTMAPGAVGRGATRAADALTPALVRRVLSLALGTGVGTVALPLGPALGTPHLTATGAAAVGVGTGPHGDGAVLAPQPGFRASSSPATPPEMGREAEDTADRHPSLRFVPSTDGSTGSAPDPRWLPSRPIRAADPDAAALLAPPPRTAPVPEDVVTVRQGDSLWAVAARHLGPGASDHAIARAWPHWYAVNADVIGDNPNLIQPGQQLRIPTPGDHR